MRATTLLGMIRAAPFQLNIGERDSTLPDLPIIADIDNRPPTE
jgi:hypothetical protein